MSKVYDEIQIRKNYAELTRMLIEKNITITSMESATSGQFISLITDTEGASSIVKGALVTYSNEAKIMEGVPSKVIETYSVYSKETAIAMAERCRDLFQADIGVGITGTMGNIDPANRDASERGHVYYAVCFGGKTQAFHIELDAQPSRLQYKLAVAKEVYETLKDLIDQGKY